MTDGDAILDRSRGLSNVTFEQRPKGSDGDIHVDNW